MQEKVIAEVHKAIEVAREAYPNKNIRMPIIKFSNRMTKASGCCKGSYVDTSTLTFSLPIMRDNDEEAFLKRTPWHEVAHHVQWEVYSVMDHGATFKHVMRNVFGKDPSRCHNYKTAPTRRQGMHPYVCDKCGKKFELGSKRHSNIINRRAKYNHSGCGGTLKYAGRDIWG
jgi:SprT protein